MSELQHAELKMCWPLLGKNVHGNMLPYICASISHLSWLADDITTTLAALIIFLDRQQQAYIIVIIFRVTTTTHFT
jgi:hypothetical protein